LAIVLTPILNGLRARQTPRDETIAADYHA
jgi:hypothetical protein